MKNILKVILCVLVCYIAIGLGWMTKDIIIHENGKDGIAILGYHGVVSEQEKKENYASNPYFMSISEFEKQMKYLADNNYQCLSMEDVEAYYHGKKEVSKKASSIYDILENNSNIIWKTTDTSKNNNKIPVIGNNKLKPEIINNNDNISFPDLKKKEGEVLWKETL